MDEPDRNRVEEVQLLAAALLGDHEPRVLELLEVLHHAEPRHLEARAERVQRLAVLPEELVEQGPAGRIGQGAEHVIHVRKIGD